jgi:hypothetical protein
LDSGDETRQEQPLGCGVLNQGVGWLAREGKLSAEKSKWTGLIKLNEQLSA